MDNGRTLGLGLPLQAGDFASPPLHIPNGDGLIYKTELVIKRDPLTETIKVNWWHLPDDVGGRARPHNHPWDFSSTVLHGALTERRYTFNDDGTPLVEELTHRAGETYSLPRGDYHVVVYVEPGTVTLMRCGPAAPGNEWGYLNLATAQHESVTPDPTFRAKLAESNRFLLRRP